MDYTRSTTVVYLCVLKHNDILYITIQYKRSLYLETYCMRCFAVRCPVLLLLCWACNSSNKLRLFLWSCLLSPAQCLTLCCVCSLVYCCRLDVVLPGISAVCVFFRFGVGSHHTAVLAVPTLLSFFLLYVAVRATYRTSARLICCCCGEPVTTAGTTACAFLLIYLYYCRPRRHYYANLIYGHICSG